MIDTINSPLYNKQICQNFIDGECDNAYEYFGAHFTKLNGEDGVIFRVWAPNAKRVSVVGEFNGWDENKNQMKPNEYGIFETFIAGVNQYDSYKYAVTNLTTELKSDPFAFHSETPYKTASKVYDLEGYEWGDKEFILNKKEPYNQPVNIYEVHLGSWKKHQDGSYYSYAEYAEELVNYCVKCGYTHVEFMPITEYPFDGSWGYQVTGYFSVSSRFGTPKDFMYLIDKCHQNGLSVILDWVPAHFPKDGHGLFMFDGTCLYEYSDESKQEHKSWGTRIFDYAKYEVVSFLTSSANFFFDKFHVDGLRVDAVASMLYLDYDRKEGEWKPNAFGGNYNLEAINFFKHLNTTIFSKYPKAMMIAEESTSFPMITKPVDIGGLGFNFKWNMGWMNDMLSYMSVDPYFRSGSHDKLTFSMFYAFSENFILPISHDEVVHGKKSLLDKMPGDVWQKFANLRVFNSYMYAHPGKKLTFMGNEYGQFKEWAYKEGLEFFMLDFELHRKLFDYNVFLNKTYSSITALYEIENSWDGFSWLSVDEKDNNVISFVRKDRQGNQLVAIFNFSGNDYYNYKLGLDKGKYKLVLNSDSKKYGGKGLLKRRVFNTKKGYAHGKNTSICFDLPAFTGLYFIKSI